MRYVISKGQVLRPVNSLGENHFPKVLLAAQATPGAFLSVACTRKGTFFNYFYYFNFICYLHAARRGSVSKEQLGRGYIGKGEEPLGNGEEPLRKGEGTVRKGRRTVRKGR